MPDGGGSLIVPGGTIDAEGAPVSWTNLELVSVLSFHGESGVFARCDIPAGTVVGVFDGEAAVFEIGADGKVDWRGQDGAMSIHLKLAGGRLYALMPTPAFPVGGIDFINHSCKPNCRCDAGVLVVETLRPVAGGEQLTINYHAMDLIKMGRPCWCTGVPEAERCIL